MSLFIVEWPKNWLDYVRKVHKTNHVKMV